MAGRPQPWGAGNLPDGQPKTTYYDPFGRSRVLPADPYSLDHYLGQGLTLKPPENPIPMEKLGDFARRDQLNDEPGKGPMSATRQVGAAVDPGTNTQTIERLEKLLTEATEALKAVGAKKGRGPDRKKRKKIKRNRA